MWIFLYFSVVYKLKLIHILSKKYSQFSKYPIIFIAPTLSKRVFDAMLKPHLLGSLRLWHKSYLPNYKQAQQNFQMF